MREINVRQFIIAPNYRQARLFCFDMNWNPRYVTVATDIVHIQGYNLKEYEVWWLDRMWPCQTHEQVRWMELMKREARFRGADIHHWWT